MRDIRSGDSEWYAVYLHQVHVPSTENHAGTQATERFLKEFSDIICDEIPNDVVLDRKYKAKIQPKDNAIPIQSKPYPIPLALEDEVKNNLQYLLERKIIEPSNSEYASPVTFTKKQDGSLRFCTDLRKVNSMIRFGNYPLPLVTELIERVDLCGNIPLARLWISSLDLAKSFWQLELDASSKHMTAFITKFGKHQFTRVPFGLVDSGNQFQCFLEHVLQG